MAKKRAKLESVGTSVSPTCLVWARRRADLPVAEVVQRIKRRTITAATIEAWERGAASPTPAQLRDLATIYRVPERWLRYPEPPRHFDDLGLVDFRTPDLAKVEVISQNLRSTIEHALDLQAWVASYRAHEGDSPVELVGSKPPTASVAEIAEHLRKVLDVESLRSAAKNSDEFLSKIRRKIESLGILVLRMGQVANKTQWKLDPEEFKGFALIDEDRLAPLIFINRKDISDAHIFTLVHELVHIVTGGSGVSREDIENIDDQASDVEKLCDSVAEELLLPRMQLDAVWHGKPKVRDAEIERAATHFKVPRLMAGRRAASIGKLPIRTFRASVKEQRANEPRQRSRGGNPYLNFPSWYGESLVRLMAAAATSDHASGSDALELLGASVETARKLARPAPKGRHEPKPLPRMKPFELIPIADSLRTSGIHR